MLSEEIWRKVVMSPNASLQEAILNLDNSGLQVVLVLSEDNILVGTLTDGDVRRALIKGLDLNAKIAQAMSKNPFTVPPDMQQESVQQVLRQNQITHLPIVEEDGQLKGMHILSDFSRVENLDNYMVIMAGGMGVRMMPLTENCPKPMLEVGGKPILQHIIEKARINGFKNIYISVNHLYDVIKDYFGDGSSFDLSIDYVHEDKPLGTAGSLSLISNNIKSHCVVTNGDVFSNVNFRDILNFHIFHSADATMAARVHELQNPFGTIDTDGVDIINLVEKPIYRSYVNAGIYVLSPRAFEYLRPGEHCDMPMLFNRVRKNGHRAIAFPIHENWTDIGNPEALNYVRNSFSS